MKAPERVHLVGGPYSGSDIVLREGSTFRVASGKFVSTDTVVLLGALALD